MDAKIDAVQDAMGAEKGHLRNTRLRLGEETRKGFLQGLSPECSLAKQELGSCRPITFWRLSKCSAWLEQSWELEDW